MSELDRLRKNVFDNLQEIERLNNIIKEVREYIDEHTENIDRGRYYEDYVETYPILEILDKENK